MPTKEDWALLSYLVRDKPKTEYKRCLRELCSRLGKFSGGKSVVARWSAIYPVKRCIDLTHLPDAAKLLQDNLPLDFECMSFTDKAYPRQLREISNPPLCLFYKGSAEVLGRTRRVGIAGTRDPSDDGREIASILSKELSRMGYLIVSGLARGIDACAHRGALDGGGLTLGVLPWLDPITPKGNEKLAEEILKAGGSILSELPIKPMWGIKNLYVRRNRIITALSDVFVAIEPLKIGGTTNAIRTARRQGRPTVCVFTGRESPDAVKLAKKNCVTYFDMVGGDVDSIIASIISQIQNSVPRRLTDLTDMLSDSFDETKRFGGGYPAK